MSEKRSKGLLNAVERIGNSLPHPNFIFVILFFVVIVISWLTKNITFSHPATGAEQGITNLLGVDGLLWFLNSMISNFINFGPLGLVLVTGMGIGLAEESGLLKSIIKTSITKAHPVLVTTIVVFTALTGNLAGSAVFVIIPPLGAMVFKALGRHPLAGLAAGFGGVAAGLSANLIIAPTDILLAGITETAAQIMDPEFTVNPAVNWYFMAASTILLTIVGTLVNEKIVEPKLGEYRPLIEESEESEADRELMTVTSEQKKGLWYAFYTLIAFIALVGLTVIPANGILRGPGGSIVPSPFLSSIAPILTLLFAATGIAYGIGAKTIKKADDIIKFLGNAMSGLAGFVVLCFFAAQFISAFSRSNLGLLISVRGSYFIEATGFTGIPLILTFIMFTILCNLFIGSASAKWILLSPIFVPMFMRLGFSPFFTQAAYRIADSVGNVISPLEPFMPFIIATAQRYDKKSGLGTVISMMLPISISYFIAWTLLLIVWYVFNIPLGPGAPIFM